MTILLVFFEVQVLLSKDSSMLHASRNFASVLAAFCVCSKIRRGCSKVVASIIFGQVFRGFGRIMY